MSLTVDRVLGHGLQGVLAGLGVGGCWAETLVASGITHGWYFSPFQGKGSLPCFFYTVYKFSAHLSLQLFLYVCVYTVTFFVCGLGEIVLWIM